ncbi:MAG: hypothetical protein AB9869_36865 [Verrucomicrobiia bacterium]
MKTKSSQADNRFSPLTLGGSREQILAIPRWVGYRLAQAAGVLWLCSTLCLSTAGESLDIKKTDSFRRIKSYLVHHGGNSSVGRIIGVIGLSLKRLFLPVSMKKAADLRFWHNPAGNKRESRGEIQIAAISLLSASVGSKSDDVNQVVKPCRALPW